MCDMMCVEQKDLKIIYHNMFPYNDEEKSGLAK